MARTRTRTARLIAPKQPKVGKLAKYKPPPKVAAAPVYGQNDLSGEGGDVQRLVLEIIDNDFRLAGGYLGRNLIVARLPDGYTAAVNDIVTVALQGNAYVVGEKIGRHNGSATWSGLPYDVNQLDVPAGVTAPAVTGLDSYPPAITQTEFADGTIRTVSDVVRYGTVGTRTVRTALFYGRQCTSDYQRAQRLWTRPLTPAPIPITLGLLAEPYPRPDGMWPAPIATGSITPVYRGPDHVQTTALPQSWIDALADGSAAGLSITPANATAGVSELALGPGGSGSLTDQYLDLSGA